MRLMFFRVCFDIGFGVLKIEDLTRLALSIWQTFLFNWDWTLLCKALLLGFLSLLLSLNDFGTRRFLLDRVIIVHSLEAIFNKVLLISWNVFIEISCALLIELHCFSWNFREENKHTRLESEDHSNQIEGSDCQEDHEDCCDRYIVLVHVHGITHLIDYQLLCYVIQNFEFAEHLV